VKPLSIMVVAGEPSGDQLAAELVRALRGAGAPFAPAFFGAGGECMAAAGVELVRDLTRHAVIGVPTPGQYAKFRRFRDELVTLAATRTPDIVVCVDFFAFNGSLAERIRAQSVKQVGIFQNWRPKLVQYVSPQVWASRAGRAKRLERTHDLLLSILPFEAAWYAQHAPGLRVEFVGHPLVERHAARRQGAPPAVTPEAGASPELLLLPGSRAGELRRHLPVMLAAAGRIAAETGAKLRMVLPALALAKQAESLIAEMPGLTLQTGGLPEALQRATVALASTGTVTLECAWFGVPTVALYKTSPLTYAIGKRIVTVKYLAMPNLLANEAVMPEFIQHEATPENLANAVIALLKDAPRRAAVRARLASVVASLGQPGASHRAARTILSLV
jgi:lipid-A-disaccharide synthase